jgi:hypothetical protein
MQDNIEKVQAIYAAFGSGDLAAFLSHLAEDVDWEHDWSGVHLPFLVPRRGRSEVVQFFDSLAVLEITQFEIVNLLAGGNQVAAVIRFGARVKPTGADHRDLEMHLWTFGEDGLVTRLRHFADTWSYAIALGLSPRPSPGG